MLITGLSFITLLTFGVGVAMFAVALASAVVSFRENEPVAGGRLVVAALMATMLWYTFGFVRVGGLRTAATLGIKMSHVHASMCLLAASSLVYAVIEIPRTLADSAESKDAP